MKLLSLVLVAACGTVSEQPDAPVPDAAPVDPCNDLDGAGCEYASPAHPVAMIEGYTVEDPILVRANPILLRYPTDATGPLPIVVWSHGGDFDNNGHHLNDAWGETIAAAGWAVIHVAHTVPDATQIRAMCIHAGVSMAECTASTFQPASVARPRDVIALLDDLPAITARLRDLTGIEIDATRVVVAGWSAGSQAPLVLAGAVRTITPSLTRFAFSDPRPLAAIALSPQGPEFSGFFETATDNSWSAIGKPVLVMTGDNDLNPSNPTLSGGIRRRAFDDLTGGRLDQHLLYSPLPDGVGGHNTYNLGDAASDDVQLVRLSSALSSTLRAFLDRSIGDPAGAAYLASDLPARLAGSATEWSSK
ncbi:MAG: hypothetical protein WKG01_02090 [Kofleriaceae bacterium]